MTLGRWTGACSIALVALLAAGCSSGGQSAPTTAVTVPHVTTTSASTTTVPGEIAVGHAQTTTGPGGQQLSVTAGQPQRDGVAVGGPVGSWEMGFILTNDGPGTFASDPASQVALMDNKGKSYAPIPESTPTTGQAATMASGQQLRILLYFELAKGATPASVSYAPFGPSVAAIRWSI